MMRQAALGHEEDEGEEDSDFDGESDLSDEEELPAATPDVTHDATARPAPPGGRSAAAAGKATDHGADADSLPHSTDSESSDTDDYGALAQPLSSLVVRAHHLHRGCASAP